MLVPAGALKIRVCVCVCVCAHICTSLRFTPGLRRRNAQRRRRWLFLRALNAPLQRRRRPHRVLMRAQTRTYPLRWCKALGRANTHKVGRMEGAEATKGNVGYGGVFTLTRTLFSLRLYIRSVNNAAVQYVLTHHMRRLCNAMQTIRFSSV